MKYKFSPKEKEILTKSFNHMDLLIKGFEDIDSNILKEKMTDTLSVKLIKGLEMSIGDEKTCYFYKMCLDMYKEIEEIEKIE